MTDDEFNTLTQAARGADLAEYFRRSGYTTQRHGAELYVQEHPGLCVNTDTGVWFCHYKNAGGSNAINCLTQVCGRDFKQAVLELTGRDVGAATREAGAKNDAAFTRVASPTVQKEGEKRTPRMPERDENMRRVFAYLCKERGIPAGVVEELAHAKLLYQSREETRTNVKDVGQTAKRCNAVFVHRDAAGDAIGGEVQGVTSYKRYKGVVAGTGDSAFVFTPKPREDGKITTAYLFESAIDLMSFYAIMKNGVSSKSDPFPEGAALVSMAGLKPAAPKRLAEQGAEIRSCVDNDDQGRAFEKANGFERFGEALEKAEVKDWNELLKKQNAAIERDKRRDAFFDTLPVAPGETDSAAALGRRR
jgi:hypothetical protein